MEDGVVSEGRYVVIEGTDGTGKSTQVERLAQRLEGLGHEVVQFHEPDGTEISAEIRTIIKNGDLARTAFTNLLLFSAARRENWLQTGLPTLERGGWVVSARDYTSTLAYQGYGEGLDLRVISRITALSTDERYMSPDKMIILDLDDEVERKRRIESRGELENPDTFESKDAEFQLRVQEAYRDIARKRGLAVVSASRTAELVEADIWRIVNS
ncbi:dTMP kinase [Candidatus Saccharibacteria bacterium TM7i]|nr:dTMP kinase [Candidatus Saccharibacteria bacterium TM7i]